MKNTISFTSTFLNERLDAIVDPETIQAEVNEISKQLSRAVITNRLEQSVKPITEILGYSYTVVSQNPIILLLENTTVGGYIEKIPLVFIEQTDTFSQTNTDIGNPSIFTHRITSQYDADFAIITNGNKWELYNTASDTSLEDSFTVDVRESVQTQNKTSIEQFVSVFGTTNGFTDKIETLEKEYETWKQQQLYELKEDSKKAYKKFIEAFSSCDNPQKHAYKTVFRSVLLAQSGVWNQSVSNDITETFISKCTAIHTGTEQINHCPTDLFNVTIIRKENNINEDKLSDGLSILFDTNDYTCLSAYNIGNVHETLVGIETDEDKNENITNGEYYTPENIVSFMSNRQVSELLRRPGVSRESLYDQITSLRIVDPAMGTGNYVFEVMERLSHELVGLSHTISNAPRTKFQDMLPDTLSNARVFVLNEILYGVDVSEISIEIAYGIAWSLTINSDTSLNTERFKQGNSIVGSTLTDVQHTAKHLGNVSSHNKSLSNYNTENNSIEELQRLVNKRLSDDEYTDVLRVLADVQTACYTDCVDVPNDALKRFIPVLEGDESLDVLTKQTWVKESQQYSKENNAFHWEIEFADVFACNGGFDLVIGNPPYVRIQELQKQLTNNVPFLTNRYQSACKNFDLYPLFSERSLELITETGQVSFIHPTNVFRAEFGEGYRELLSSKQCVKSILSFGYEQVFDNASVYTAIVTLSGTRQSTFKYAEQNVDKLNSDIKYDDINADYGSTPWLLANKKTRETIKQIETHNQTVGDITNVFVGLQTGMDSVYVVDSAPTCSDTEEYTHVIGADGNTWELESELLKPTIKGKDVERYVVPESDKYIIVPYTGIENGQRLLTQDEMATKYHHTFSYLSSFEESLRGRDNGKMNHDEWFGLSRPQNISRYESPKIITPEVARGSTFTLDTEKMYHVTTVYGIQLETTDMYSLHSLLGILNTPLLWYYLKHTGYQVRGGYAKFKTKYLNEFPLPVIEKNESVTDDERERLIERSMSMYRSTVVKEDRIPSWFVTPPVTTCPCVLEELIGKLAKRQMEHGEDDVTNELIEELVCSLYGIDSSRVTEPVQ